MRLRNNIFAEAFKWLKKNWDGIRYQKDLAAKIGVSEDTITRIMRDQTEVTDDFLCKFNEAFDNVFNYQWLRGEDPFHMLTADLIEAKAEKAEPYIDPSSQTNATISAYIEAIESLKRELRTKDDLLAEKDARLAEKIDTCTCGNDIEYDLTKIFFYNAHPAYGHIFTLYTKTPEMSTPKTEYLKNHT